mgnify:CR=1 FL=1
MLKLTGLTYKLKVSALERYHNITEHNQSLLFNFENDLDTARAVNGD